MKPFYKLALLFALTTGALAVMPASVSAKGGLYSDPFRSPSTAGVRSEGALQFGAGSSAPVADRAFRSFALSAAGPVCNQPPDRHPQPPLVVPEPSVYMLLGVGLLFCGQRFLRRRRSS